MGIMMKDRDFLLLFSSFSAGLGFINALLTLTEQIVEPYGYSTGDAGWMGALLMVGGLVGAGATGAVLDKVRKCAN
jgi:FLVCR family MFS transporter 7